MGADPSFKVIGAAYPYVASRLLTDPAPQLRQAFIEVLFKVTADETFHWLAPVLASFRVGILTERGEKRRVGKKKPCSAHTQQDKRFRWSRLENLLRESSKSSDYRFSSALRPLLKLILSTDESNAEIRNLVETEAVRVAEALTLGNLVASIQGNDAGEVGQNAAIMNVCALSHIRQTRSFILGRGRYRLHCLQQYRI